MLKITLQSGEVFTLDKSESIFTAAMKNAVHLPHSCKNGRCSNCKCRVLTGKTSALENEIGLTEAEKNAGWILSCVRTATTDVLLDFENWNNIPLPPIKTLPCRIQALEKLSSDVMKVMLRLPPTAEFDYLPGQYVDVIGSNGVRRNYSLAKANFADKLLELHIRAVPSGTMSRYWFEQAKVNDLLRFNGPLGSFFLRDVSNTHVVFLATGTGIAPVKAMLEALQHRSVAEQPQSVTVFWGGRTVNDLYLNMELLTSMHTVIPVLSRPTPNWTGARGHVQDILLDRQTDLTNTVVYACGSAVMVHTARQSLLQAGLTANRFYSDAFVCSAPSSS